MKKSAIVSEYDSIDYVSQSLLKAVMNPDSDTRVLNELPLLKGNYLDCLITMNDEIDDLYYIMDCKYPTDMYKKVVDYYKENSLIISDFEYYINYHREEYLNYFRTLTSVKWKDDTVIKNSLEEASDYWNHILYADDKIIIDVNIWESVTKAAESLRHNPITSEYLKVKEELFEEIQFQKCIYFKYKDVFCKARLDVAKINHRDKTFQVIDVKSTSVPLNDWKRNIARKTKVDFQLAFYNEAMKIEYPNYTMINPVLLVESVVNPGKPLCYQLSNDDLMIGKHGAERIRNHIIVEDVATDVESSRIYGFDEAIDVYKDFKKSNLSSISEYYYNKYLRENKPIKLELWT